MTLVIRLIAYLIALYRVRILHSKSWYVIECEDDSRHVYPLGDKVIHYADEDCICGPRPELINTGDGDHWLYTHHSLDGREVRERA